MSSPNFSVAILLIHCGHFPISLCPLLFLFGHSPSYLLTLLASSLWLFSQFSVAILPVLHKPSEVLYGHSLSSQWSLSPLPTLPLVPVFWAICSHVLYEPCQFSVAPCPLLYEPSQLLCGHSPDSLHCSHSLTCFL